MKKRLVSGVVAVTMAAMMACPVFAAWQPSKTVQEVNGVQASVTSADGTTADLEITMQPKTAANSSVLKVVEDAEPYIKVTPVSQTQAANETVDVELPELAYAEKANETTETGLQYSDNEKVNLIFETVTRSTSTTQFLEKVGGNLLNLVTEAVTAISDAQTEQSVTIDDFAPAALFDVTASAGALEQMGENGSVDVELEVPGITAESNIIAIHFLGDMADVEAARESLTSDFENAILNYDAEILDAVAGDGTVTVTMTGFSPVLILAQTAATPAATEAPAETEEPAAGTVSTPEPSAEPTQAEPATDNGGNGWVLPVVIVVIVVVVVVAVVVTRKNKSKQTTTTGSKK